MTSNKENSKNQEIGEKKPRSMLIKHLLLACLLSCIFGIPAYFQWKSHFYDPHHQVPIICTVTVAEQYTSTSSGSRYGSSRDYLFFETEECRNLLLPISSDDDYQSMLDEIQIGKKYEFMMGESQVGVTSGARKVFSYSGPVE